MGLISTVTNIARGRFGFKMDEVMTGQHWFEPGEGPAGPHFMEFSGKWGPDDVRDWANPSSDQFMNQVLEGKATVGGLCDDAPMIGTLKLDYFGEHKLRYTFNFEAGGTEYKYVGEKVNIRPWNLPVSHTTCFGRLTEAKTSKLVSTSVTFFKLHTSPKFLGSFRFTQPD